MPLVTILNQVLVRKESLPGKMGRISKEKEIVNLDQENTIMK